MVRFYKILNKTIATIAIIVKTAPISPASAQQQRENFGEIISHQNATNDCNQILSELGLTYQQLGLIDHIQIRMY